MLKSIMSTIRKDSQPSPIPQIHLLCLEDSCITAFNAALAQSPLPPNISITVHSGFLSNLPSSVRFDTIVSPANSYARLDGGFDHAISRAVGPTDDYFALTHHAQGMLHEEWRGFAPPGSCTLVDLPAEWEARSRNVWGVKRVALCPTMRLPQDVRWDKEVVYEAMWSLLCAVDRHNRNEKKKKTGEDGDEIRSILMSPLATGTGKVSPEKWAAQVVLAMKHFVDSLEGGGTFNWQRLEVPDIFDINHAIEKTTGL